MYELLQMVVRVLIVVFIRNHILTSTLHRFHASRYPTKPSDTAHKFNPATHNHVVFIRKNKFFSVPLVNAEGIELTAAELEVYVFRNSRTFI